jgi:hypothetical protein
LKEYDQARAGARALVRDVMTTADPPEVVADAVLQAATAARAATLHRRQGCATGQRAASVRARRDVRQKPPQADALARLNDVIAEVPAMLRTLPRATLRQIRTTLNAWPCVPCGHEHALSEPVLVIAFFADAISRARRAS